jgi:hypothetical protein
MRSKEVFKYMADTLSTSVFNVRKSFIYINGNPAGTDFMNDGITARWTPMLTLEEFNKITLFIRQPCIFVNLPPVMPPVYFIYFDYVSRVIKDDRMDEFSAIKTDFGILTDYTRETMDIKRSLVGNKTLFSEKSLMLAQILRVAKGAITPNIIFVAVNEVRRRLGLPPKIVVPPTILSAPPPSLNTSISRISPVERDVSLGAITNYNRTIFDRFKVEGQNKKQKNLVVTTYNNLGFIKKPNTRIEEVQQTLPNLKQRGQPNPVY